MTDDRLSGFVRTLEALPPYVGLVFRGFDGPAPAHSVTLAGVLPTSLDPRVASENAATPGLAVIVSKTGRSIGPLSAHPDEQEVVLLPGTTLSPVARVASPPFGEVTVLEELSVQPVPGLPADLQQLADAVYAALGAAAVRADVVVHSPGKFRGA